MWYNQAMHFYTFEQVIKSTDCLYDKDSVTVTVLILGFLCWMLRLEHYVVISDFILISFEKE